MTLYQPVKLDTPLLVPILLIAGLSLFTSCSAGNNSDSAYRQKIDQWHQQRIASLEQKDSWLSLAGLFALGEGSHTVGGDSSNAIIFPPERSPGRIGSIVLEDGEIRMQIEPGTKVYHDSSLVDGSIAMKSDSAGNPTVLRHGSLRWFVIERGGELFVRLKDTEHPRLESFSGIERYPVSRQWRVRATFRPFEETNTIRVPNILGQVRKAPLHGVLEFSIGDEQYSLAPLGSPSEDEFFVIFGDETNGETTYGGGRFVYVQTPDENGTTYIDFNKAYNPPCVFSPHATCPLPPVRNKLSLKITAGEKMYGESH